MARKRKVGSPEKGTQGKAKSLSSARIPRLGPYIPFGPSPERDALCKELGIEVPRPRDSAQQSQIFGSLFPAGEAASISPTEDKFESIRVWTQIGLKLAAERREYSVGKRGRGRPSLSEQSQMSTDYARYNYLWAIAHRSGEQLNKRGNQKAAISREMDAGNPLFAEQLDTLEPSVTRGKRLFRKAAREFLRELIADYREACGEFRRRAAWLETVKPDADRLEELNRILTGTNMLVGFLSPAFSERWHLRETLREKLRNPFEVAIKS